MMVLPALSRNLQHESAPVQTVILDCGLHDNDYARERTAGWSVDSHGSFTSFLYDSLGKHSFGCEYACYDI